MDEPIDQGRRHDVVPEDVAPFLKALIDLMTMMITIADVDRALAKA